jgi:hypothetical protein
VHQISRRIIRKLRRLGYLEAGIDAAVATGYDPLGEDEPELARTPWASVQQRIAFGERAGQKVRRIGSGFGYEGERPALTGTRCASVHGFSLYANVSVPAHRRDQLERWRSWRRWCRCRGCTWYAMAAVCAADKRPERIPHRRSTLERSVVKQPPYLDLVTGEEV